MLTARFFKQQIAQKFPNLGMAILIVAVSSVVAIALIYTVITLTLSWQAWLTIAVMVATLWLNALTSYPPEVIFLGGLGILFVTGVVGAEDALAGFSNPGMVTVGVLYVVVAGLQQTGGLNWVSQHVLGLPKGLFSALVRLIFPVLGMSAFLNNTPVVAMFVPVVSDWARKLRISPSKLMIPLSYAAIFGGICTLIGTSTNLVVNGLLISKAGYPGMNMFDITRVSLPCALIGAAYLLTAGRWLLPNRKPALSEQDNPREYKVEMVVEAGSPLAGKTIEKAGLRHLPGLFLGEIVRAGQVIPAVSPQEQLQEHDQLIFVGIVDSIVDLKKMRGLVPATNQVEKLDVPPTARRLIEAVVSNTCPVAGQTIRKGQFRNRYNAVILAVARNGERLQGKIGDIILRPGDVLLLEAPPTFLAQQRSSRDFYLVSDVPNSEPLRHQKAPIALGILVAMVALATFGWMDMLQAATLAAMVMVLARCSGAGYALGNVQWSVLLVIAAALGIGQALETTGAAGTLAGAFIGLAGQNPWMALAAVYAVTSILTEVITNNAAAVLVFPIALAVSKSLGVDFMPFAIAIMIGASASFSTPIGYQTNLMVYGPGGYRFGDFMRIGLPLNLIFWVLTVLLAPRVFPF
ncbi:SLC13 family permease [Romeria aff. gracilis LEGE 07310]|uniref:SLC13 family permease n=1 Tax=Vasconcelosia minhoensis LEGE 07310 TaxID=915328 RepID=A0A8J7DSA9_9CYAN|nr:SLC13 family permease [Romeria gracilis]MBE9079924.1 SLC13 family permease [Romeria aff. gracilis LEGE 07310]